MLVFYSKLLLLGTILPGLAREESRVLSPTELKCILDRFGEFKPRENNFRMLQFRDSMIEEFPLWNEKGLFWMRRDKRRREKRE